VAGGREGVHAVLEHVEIERTQIDDGKLIDGVVDAMELEGRVPVEDLFGQLTGAGQHVAVERQQLRWSLIWSVSGVKPARLPSRKRKVFRSLR